MIFRGQRRCRGRVVQAAPAPGWGALCVVLALGACQGNPIDTPVNWWHQLQGGAIAKQRPPPPGADLPYPHLGTIPKKPTVPSAAFRQTVSKELTATRDTTERQAARLPIDTGSLPPPPPKPTQPTPGAPAAESANTANATLPAADAPAPKPAATPDNGPPPGTALTFVGAAPDESGLPAIPGAPPPPPDFEAVPPAPPAAPLPAPPAPAAGSTVLFATGEAVLNPSQEETVRDIALRRGKGSIGIAGHGEAASDTPGAQQAALELGLKRAQAVAAALVKLHVPQDRLLLSATAFGRDATLTLLP